MRVNMDHWKGSIALVTGASSGIGAEICKKLAKHGVFVYGCARKVAALETLENDLNRDPDVTKNGGKLKKIKCDVSDEKDVLAMFHTIQQEKGFVDICINNAGVIERAPLVSADTTKWRNTMKVNILGTCMCTREAIKLMEGRKGIVIQMGCIGGHKMASIPKNVRDPGVSFFNGTKSMVKALASGLRQELKAKNSNIRVSTISPGPVNTEMLAKLQNAEALDLMADLMAADNPKKPRSEYISAFPKEEQCLKPEEIANAVIYILSVPEDVNVDDIVIGHVAFPV